MEIELGITFTLIYLQLLLLLAYWQKWIAWPIIVGGLVRLVCAWLIALNVIAPPGTTADARVFQRIAREWSELDWGSLMLMFDPGKSFVISWVGAVIYKLFGPSPIMLNVINAFVGTLLIVLTFRLAMRLIGAERARTVAWIAALFPYAVLYGSVFRREVFGAAGFMIGLLYVVAWQQQARLLPIGKAVLGFALASLFHGAYSVAVLVLGVLAVWDGLKQLTVRSASGGLGRAGAFAAGAIGGVLVLAVVAHAVTSGLQLGSFGDVQQNVTSIDGALERRTAVRVSDGGSSYPGVLTGEDPFKRPWVIPGRIVYFVFSPFPWDIRAPIHLLGLIASVCFAYIAASIWGSRKFIRSRPDVATIFIIMAVMIFVFGVSIDNIGTSIRHRTKFVFALLALCCAPVFGRAGRSRAARPGLPVGGLASPPSMPQAALVRRAGLR